MENREKLNDSSRKFLNKIIPPYAIVPLSVMAAVGIFTFYITPIWTDSMYHYSLETAVDALIPFVPVFILPYVLAYLQWLIGYIRIAGSGEIFCKTAIYGEVIAKILVCIVFCVYPTTMTRWQITGTDIFSKMVALIYRLDTPTNLFPSIHCLESWICFRCSFNREYFSRRYTVVMGITSGFVFLSTVFIKQHVVVDIFAGIAAAEAGLFVTKKIGQGFKKSEISNAEGAEL